MINTAELGITIQKIICDAYEVEPSPKAVEQFAANYNPRLGE